jgi:hypothetical protein
MKNSTLVLYAVPAEARWLRYEPKFCIGVKGNLMTEDTLLLREPSRVILFGSCGLLYRNLSLDEFVVDRIPFLKFAGAQRPIRTKELAELYRDLEPVAGAVEMEITRVWSICKALKVPLFVVKYPIDRCDKKAMPIGLNHFWRIFQHWRMQRRFDQFMKIYEAIHE